MRKRTREDTVFTVILNTLSKYFKVLVILMLLVIVLSGVRFVKSGHSAIILRMGKLVGNTYEEQVHDPGLLLAFPYIIDEVIIVPSENVIEQKITTHYTKGNIENLCRECGYVITGDQSVAVMSATVKYKITDVVSYALNSSDMEATINGIVSNAMTEIAANMNVDDILTSGKEAYSRAVILNAQEKLDAVNTGVRIQNLELTKVGMPEEVREIYEAVTTANVYAGTILEEAEQYKNKTLPWAQSESDSLISSANSAHSEAIADANARLSEFWGMKEEYENNKEVVKLRIYNEKVKKAISKIGKVKVVQEGESKIIIE